VSHILAFSPSHYSRFRNPNTLEPLTPRDALGTPIGPPNTTLLRGVERGNSVTKMITPNVLAAVRQHFGCDELNGLELEQQGGPGTSNSHIEKRLFPGDLMSGSLWTSDPPVYSNTTMAVFADSGWYQVDFRYATASSWGRRKGCNFALEKCVSLNASNFAHPSHSDHFCAGQSYACRGFHFSPSLCRINFYNNALPPEFSYFKASAQYPSASDRYGGIDELMDYCPSYLPYTVSSAKSLYSDCRFTENAHDHVEYSRDSYGPNSRCVASNIVRNNSWYSLDYRCFVTECHFGSGEPSLAIKVDNVRIDCGTEGGQTVFVNTSVSSGWLICPLTSSICINTCPHQCSGLGNCVKGVCFCNPGMEGSDCSKVKTTFQLRRNLSVAVNTPASNLSSNASFEANRTGYLNQSSEADSNRVVRYGEGVQGICLFACILFMGIAGTENLLYK
jgi:hypothetical protein